GFGWVIPAPAVKIRQRDPAPLYVVGKFAFQHLDVHHHVAGLLDLPDAAEAHVLAEAAHDGALNTQAAQITTGTYAWKNKENESRAGQGEQAQQCGNRGKRGVELNVLPRWNTRGERFPLRPPHLHADERRNGHEDK